MLLTSLLLLRLARKRPRADSPPVAVTVLKPLHGDEPGLFARLSLLCRQNYAGPTQIVFGCQDHNDEAIGVVGRLQAALPGHAIDLKIDPRCSGTNRKVSNLINMVSLARHDVLVVADSDIEVGPDYLGNVVAALQRPGVGAVTCLYHGIAGTTLAGCLASLTINAHFLPSIVFGVACRLANPCFGSTIALKRETLDRIGGFEAFAYCVADDHAIGRAVRDGGSRVAILPCTVGHACDYRSLREFFGHELRCARVIRSIDPIGYAGAVLANPLPLALGAIFCSGENGGALFLAFAAIVCRIALCRCVKVGFGLPRQPYWLLPLADIIAFLSFISGFFGSSVTWRGHRYRILSGQLGEELP